MTLALALGFGAFLHQSWKNTVRGPASRSSRPKAVRDAGLPVVPGPGKTPPPAMGKPKNAIVDLRRVSWRAARVGGTTERLGRPRRITLHHFGDRNVTAYSRESTAKLLRGIQENHQRKRRWVDIGYHYIVDRAGRVWEGRPLSLVGAHAGPGGANEGNIGILVLGNFERQHLTVAQQRRLRRCVDELRDRYGIPLTEVLSHREIRQRRKLTATDCPGRRLRQWLQRYRRSEGAVSRAN